MSNLFDERIKSLEAEIEALKTVRRRASSTIPTTSEVVTISPTIIGTKIGNTNYAFAEKAGVIVVQTNDPGFVSFSVVTNAGSRRYFTESIGDANGNNKFRLYIQFPSSADASELGGSGRKTVPVQIKITSTSDFTHTISQEDI